MPLVRNHSARPASGGGTDPSASLTSASSDERWAAARATESPESVPSLAQALVREKDARVREAIFTALARISTRESALATLPYLRADEAGIRAGALDALRAMPKATQSHMAELLADKDPDVRLLACDLVRDMGDADGARLLCELLETDPEANVCAAAVEVVAEIADGNALPSLSRCASRFPNDPFLTFAIKVASDRLRSGSAKPRG
jgi:HEAT repeat protein